MYHYCKLCGECLLQYLVEPPTFRAFKCHLCPEYHLLLSFDMKKIWEDLQVKNLRLIVKDNIATAQMKSEVSIYMKDLYSFPLNELTHELAVQWVKRLKTCVVFQ